MSPRNSNLHRSILLQPNKVLQFREESYLHRNQAHKTGLLETKVDIFELLKESFAERK